MPMSRSPTIDSTGASHDPSGPVPYGSRARGGFGRTWRVDVQVDPRFRERATDILKLQVKNKENQLVRLGTVMEVREVVGLMGIERHNLYPVARITANPAEGTPLGEAKSLCESLAGQELGTERFKLIWRAR